MATRNYVVEARIRIAVTARNVREAVEWVEQSEAAPLDNEILAVWDASPVRGEDGKLSSA